jgi:ankyrin repeat protein
MVGVNDDSQLTFIVHIHLPRWPSDSDRLLFHLEIIINIGGDQTILALKERIIEKVLQWATLGQDEAVRFGEQQESWTDFRMPSPDRQKLVVVGDIGHDRIEARRKFVATKVADLKSPAADGRYWNPDNHEPIDIRLGNIHELDAVPVSEVDGITITDAGLSSGNVLLLTEQEDMASACCNGNLSVVEERLSRGADPNTTARSRYFSGPAPQMLLNYEEHGNKSREEDEGWRRQELRRCNDRGWGRDGDMTPNEVEAASVFHTPVIFCAAAKGHRGIVEVLLREGAMVDSLGEKGQTPLSIATHQNYLEIVELLLRAGADVEGKWGDLGNDVLTPLMMATAQGLIRIVNLLVEYGADINATNEKGKTALIFAVKSYKEEGFLDGELDRVGWPRSGIFWGAGRVRNEHARVIGVLSVVKVLINKGANMRPSRALSDDFSESGRPASSTPLEFALEKNYWDLAAALRGDHFWPFPNLSGKWVIKTVDRDEETDEQFEVASFVLERDDTKEFIWFKSDSSEEYIFAQLSHPGAERSPCNHYTGSGVDYVPTLDEDDGQANHTFSMENCRVTLSTEDDRADEMLFSYEQHFQEGPQDGKIVKWEMKVIESTGTVTNGEFFPKEMVGVFGDDFYTEHGDAWKKPEGANIAEAYYAVRTEADPPPPVIAETEPDPELGPEPDESPPPVFTEGDVRQQQQRDLAAAAAELRLQRASAAEEEAEEEEIVF